MEKLKFIEEVNRINLDGSFFDYNFIKRFVVEVARRLGVDHQEIKMTIQSAGHGHDLVLWRERMETQEEHDTRMRNHRANMENYRIQRLKEDAARLGFKLVPPENPHIEMMGS